MDKYELMRIDYDNLTGSEQAELQNHFDNNLIDYWRDVVLEENLVHYDNVDGIDLMAWELYLES